MIQGLWGDSKKAEGGGNPFLVPHVCSTLVSGPNCEQPLVEALTATPSAEKRPILEVNYQTMRPLRQ